SHWPPLRRGASGAPPAHALPGQGCLPDGPARRAARSRGAPEWPERSPWGRHQHGSPSATRVGDRHAPAPLPAVRPARASPNAPLARARTTPPRRPARQAAPLPTDARRAAYPLAMRDTPRVAAEYLSSAHSRPFITLLPGPTCSAAAACPTPHDGNQLPPEPRGQTCLRGRRAGARETRVGCREAADPFF